MNVHLGKIRFVRDECRQAGACGCGHCKRDGQCDYGDCRETATARCVIFGYPTCGRHATAHGVRHNGRIMPAYYPERGLCGCCKPADALAA